VAAFDAGTATQIDQAIEQINMAVGMDIQKDLLRSFGDEWAYYVDPAVAGNGIVGATLVNRLRSPAKAEASIDKLEKFINAIVDAQLAGEKPKMSIAFRQAKFDQTTVHYLGLPLLQPAWAVSDGNLYIALYPEVVAAAARHVSAKGESITDNPDFTNLRRRFGEHHASSFEFTDLPRLVPNTYSSWVVISHLAGAGDLFGVPAPTLILPSLGKMMTHLAPAGEISWADADGLHFSALSPFPGSEILASDPTSMSAAQVPVLISILLPALNKARQQAQQVKSAANLKNIGLAAQIYANNQKNGAFPKDFAVMMKETDLTVDIFVNPRTNTAAPREAPKEQQLAWVRDQSDYVWNGAGKKSTTVGGDDPIAWEKPEGLTGGINILFGDGHVQFEAMPYALEVIRKAQHSGRGL
jgi:prepilin-type processing-associated H-X9-DG protein